MKNIIPQEREELIQDLIGRYSKMSLEEILKEPLIEAYRLDRDELRQRIQQHYCQKLANDFSQAKDDYSRINGTNNKQSSTTSPVNNRPQSPETIQQIIQRTIQQYKALTYNIQTMDEMFQRLHEDFHLATILVPVKLEGKEGEQGKRENLAETLPACLYSLGIKVNENYLGFLVKTQLPGELATDKFGEFYGRLLNVMGDYEKKVNLSAQEKKEHNNALAQIEFNYQRAVDMVRGEIQHQQKNMYGLCLLVYAFNGHFLEGSPLFQNGDKVFQNLYNQYQQISLRYGKLLSANQSTLMADYAKIKTDALRLQAAMLPNISLPMQPNSSPNIGFPPTIP